MILRKSLIKYLNSLTYKGKNIEEKDNHDKGTSYEKTKGYSAAFKRKKEHGQV